MSKRFTHTNTHTHTHTHSHTHTHTHSLTEVDIEKLRSMSDGSVLVENVQNLLLGLSDCVTVEKLDWH